MTEPVPAELLEVIISTLPSGLVTTDEDGRIRYANPAAGHILGRNATKLHGVRLTDIRGELAAMNWPADKGEILLLPAGPARPSSHESRMLGFTSRAIHDNAGNKTGMVISFADITADKLRVRDEEHRRRLADIGTVVASIAHEIRNPLFAIASLVQSLAAEEALSAVPDAGEIIKRVLGETRRVAHLVEDLLAFGRSKPIERRKLDVVRLVTGIVEELGDMLTQDSESSLHLKIGPDLIEHPGWSVDPEAMRQIVMNLVRNAHHAALEAEQQESRTFGIEIRIDRGPNWLELVVEDRGIGIPAEFLPHVFEAFFTTREGGTGLGLSITHRLVQQHNGTISLQSVEGRGTVITVRVPP